MKKEIKIVIADDLTPQQEAIEISKKLAVKMLGQNTFSHKKIGTEVNIKHLKTTIVIERKSKEKPIDFIPCPFCGTLHQSNIFFPVYTNYGGKVKKHKLCSENCQLSLIDICGIGRASKRNNLKHFMNNWEHA